MPAAEPIETWPSTIREFVHAKQERAYRRLGVQLGLGPDPAKAFARFSRPKMPLSYISARKWAADFGVKLTAVQERDLDAHLATIYSSYFSEEPPTSFEEPNRYGIMVKNRDFAQQAYASAGISISPQPFLATLPSGHTNAAISVEPETGSPVVFFEAGLFEFLHDFSVLVAWAAVPISFKEFYNDEALAQLRGPHIMPFQTSDFFVDTLYAYVVSGTPIVEHNRKPNPAHNLLIATELYSKMTQFVMAHEFAHLHLGHLENPPGNQREAWAQEYEADTLAVLALTKLAQENGMSWAVAFWACDLALTFLHILDEAILTMAFDSQPSWVSRTHPESLSRRRRLREIIEIGYLSSSGWTKIRHLLKRGAASFGRGSTPEFQFYRSFREIDLRLASYVNPIRRKAVGELCGMTDALLGRLFAFAMIPLVLGRQRGARPSVIWNKHIASSFA